MLCSNSFTSAFGDRNTTFADFKGPHLATVATQSVRRPLHESGYGGNPSSIEVPSPL